MRNARAYPPRSIWQVMREEALQRAGHRCELCGLPDAALAYNEGKPHPFYPQGKPYHIYLQLCHKQQYQTWNREAETLVLCPSCHRKFDARFGRKKAVKRSAPVGLVVLWVWYKGERCLAAEARYFDDVFQAVASFEVGFLFEIEAELLTRLAGRGHYRRTEAGIEVRRETGACQGFGLLLEDVLQGVC